MNTISGNYRRVDPADAAMVGAELADSWKHASIPIRQWESAVVPELERLRAGKSLPPVFDALIRALNQIPKTGKTPRLLEVGASSCFYSEVLERLGFACAYEGLDYSIYFQQMAKRIYPNVPFHVGDAASMIFQDDTFDIVISGSVIIHAYNAKEMIAEAARVASGHVVMARTPLVVTGHTQYFVKEAYGIPVFECHYNEFELLGMFSKCGLTTLARETIFENPAANSSRVTYLLEKN